MVATCCIEGMCACAEVGSIARSSEHLLTLLLVLAGCQDFCVHGGRFCIPSAGVDCMVDCRAHQGIKGAQFLYDFSSLPLMSSACVVFRARFLAACCAHARSHLCTS